MFKITNKDLLNQVFNEDCLEGMKQIEDKSIDLVLTDFPYGTTNAKWDSIDKLEEWIKEINRISKKSLLISTASQPFTTKLINANFKNFRYELIWEKNRGTGIFNAKKMPMKSHENIVIFYDKLPTYNPQMRKGKPYKAKQGKQSDVFGLNTGKEIVTTNEGERYPLSVLKFNSTNGKNIHPTQKPLDLIEYLIKTYSNDGDVILDPFMGSFTTAIAALNTNRNYIGFEFDKEYFQKGQERIQKWHEENK